jgi:murein DD-endopeptidase MepM/ murein hydrolase activator NlpD
LLALLVAIAVATAPLPATRAAPIALVWPAQGTITTPFVQGGHPGIDIGILRSLTIRAAAPGRVTLVGERRGFEGYGRIVLVDVGGQYANLYAHLSRFSVRPGDEVAAGQPIGVAGCTGWCTGTHLHFELRFRGTPIDPRRLPILPAEPEALAALSSGWPSG